MTMVEDMTLGGDIDGQGIMAFANLQTDAKDHDPGNANEGEEVDAIEMEHVEVLVEGWDWGGGGALVLTWMMLLPSDHDSLQGVS